MGQVWSWGWGEFGQLGLGFSAASYKSGTGGMASKRLTPQAIGRDKFDNVRVRFVACGGAFSAAITDVNQLLPGFGGNLYLWGANEVGQCAQPSKKPVEVETPAKVRPLKQTIIRSVACGASHIIAVDTAGRAYSWGSAQYGQLGSSQPPKVFTPPLAVDFAARGDAVDSGLLAQHQPMLIQSVSRLHIMKA